MLPPLAVIAFEPVPEANVLPEPSCMRHDSAALTRVFNGALVNVAAP